MFVQTQYLPLQVSVVYSVLETKNVPHDCSREEKVSIVLPLLLVTIKLHILVTLKATYLRDFLRVCKLLESRHHLFPTHLHTFCLPDLCNIFNTVLCLKCLVNMYLHENLSTLTLVEFSLVRRISFELDYIQIRNLGRMKVKFLAKSQPLTNSQIAYQICLLYCRLWGGGVGIPDYDYLFLPNPMHLQSKALAI